MVTLTPQVENLEFDPVKQLVPITNVGTGAQVMAIKRSLPATNLPEFLAYAKANPGKLNFTVGRNAKSQPFLAGAAVQGDRRRSRHGAGA